MNLDWSSRRKIIYGVAAVFLLVGFILYEGRAVFFPAPTCFDKKQNGYESGADCGGTCSLRCADDIAPLSVEWSQAIKTSTSTYDLVAMVANRNSNSAPRTLPYVFVPLDTQGNVIKNVEGLSIAVVDGDFPIIQQNVVLSRPPVSVATRISPGPLYAVSERSQFPIIRVMDWRYEQGSISRMYVTIRNTSRTVFMKLPVRVIAFDARGNAVAAGESIVPSLGKDTEQEVVFTWHNQLSTAPTQVRVYPILDPFILVQ